METHILDTAFVKFLKKLTPKDRAKYIQECFEKEGDLAFKLAQYLDEYDPYKLALKLENHDEA